MGKLESELISLGFQQNRATNWTRKHDIVQVVRSSEHPKVRVTWREYWKDFLAIIFDYSKKGGPICIVPTKEFFNSQFVSQKRKEQAYVNSGNYWSQVFDAQDPLPQLILKFENRWDILGGKRVDPSVGWPFSKKKGKKGLGEGPPPPPPSSVIFEGMLKAIGDDKHLLRLYCDLMEELRERKIVRSGNNPVSDYGEKIVAEKLNLKLAEGSNKGYDAIDQQKGLKYQIKSRRTTKHKGSKQLGVIRNLDQRLFDYLIAVIFDEFLVPSEMWQIPIDLIPKYAKYSEHQNGHILILTGGILQENTVKKLL